jgi:AraC-like DNA-binding protein
MSTKNLAMLVDPLYAGRHRLKSHLSVYFKVQEFASNEAALTKVHRMSPQLLVLVIRGVYPEPWGLVRHMRFHNRLAHLPILCLADPSEPSFVEQALEAGVDMVIPTESPRTLFQTACRRLVDQWYSICKYSYQRYLYDHNKVPLASEDELFLGSLHEYTRKNMHKVDLQVADMADALSLSCSQLDRRLDRLLGMSPKQFLSEHRLFAAFDLLANRRGNVSEVSSWTGFKSLSYFSTRFSERFQANPSVVRENRVSSDYAGPWKEMASRLGLNGPIQGLRPVNAPSNTRPGRRSKTSQESGLKKL